MKGPCIFKGYYKRDDKTADAYDAEGWFLSGDVGMVYPNGSVKIIDRSKNIFKLSQGEYIAPEKLENIFVLSPYVAQSMVYGHSLQSCTVAIVIPEEQKLNDWMKANGKTDAAAALLEDASFKKEIMADLVRLAKENNLSGLEKPKDIFISTDPFSIDNDMLTPTFKLKRNIA